MRIKVIKGPLFERCLKQSYIYLRRVVEEKIRTGEYKEKID